MMGLVDEPERDILTELDDSADAHQPVHCSCIITANICHRYINPVFSIIGLIMKFDGIYCEPIAECALKERPKNKQG